MYSLLQENNQELRHFFALQVRVGKEHIIKEQINNKIQNENSLEIYIIKRKIIQYKNKLKKIIPQILFPGYIIIETILTSSLVDEIRNINHVYKFLGSGDYINPIPKHVMIPLINLMNDKHVIDISNALKEGDKVNIISGPLKGNESIIKQLIPRKHRAVVSLEFDGVIQEVNLGINILIKNEA